MKKKSIFLMILSTVLLLSSCSNDELGLDANGNETVVSFSVGVNEVAQTRAISDGTGAKQLTYAVFDENGTRITTYQKTTVDVTSYPYNVQIRLAKNHTYKVAFWAQNPDCEAYTLDDNMVLTVNYTNAGGTNASNNDELRDAFYACKEIAVTNNTIVDVTLYRPFAQLNAGVYQEDWDAALQTSEIKTSSVKVTNVPNTLNLVDGSTSGDVTVEYAATALPSEELSVDLNYDGTMETYKWLSMSYLLAHEKGIVEEIEFSFMGEDEKNNPCVVTNAPLQRNHRTNVVGHLLSGQVTYKVVIDERYDVPDYNIERLIMNEDELKAAISFSTEHEVPVYGILGANIELTSTCGLNNADLTLNMNGFTIKTQEGVNTTNGMFYLPYGSQFNIKGEGIIISNSANSGGATTTEDTSVTQEKRNSVFNLNGNNTTVPPALIIDGDIDVTSKNGFAIYADYNSPTVTVNGNASLTSETTYVIYASADSKIELNNGKYIGITTAVQAYKNAEVIINGGYYAVADNDAYNSTYLLNIIDGSRTTASITVYGGQFKGYNPSTDVGGDGIFAATAYTATETETETGSGVYIYEVKKVEADSPENLKSLIEIGETDITLTKTIDLTSDLDLSTVSTLNLGNKNLNVNPEVQVIVAGTTGISNGTIKLSNNSTKSVMLCKTGANLTLEKITVSGGSGKTTPSIIECESNANITLQNEAKITYALGHSIKLAEGCSLTLNNATITAKNGSAVYYDGTGTGGVKVEMTDFYLNNLNNSTPAMPAIYLMNNASGNKNTLIVKNTKTGTNEGIRAQVESAIRVANTDVTAENVRIISGLSTATTGNTYDGSDNIGHGIVLAGVSDGSAYEGTVNLSNITYVLKDANASKVLKYSGTLFEVVTETGEVVP